MARRAMFTFITENNLYLQLQVIHFFKKYQIKFVKLLNNVFSQELNSFGYEIEQIKKNNSRREKMDDKCI